jgi:hypothetical protein
MKRSHCGTSSAIPRYRLWALVASGVEFREIVSGDGTIDCWQRPELADWELPRRDPNEPRPNAPEVLARRRAAVQRCESVDARKRLRWRQGDDMKPTFRHRRAVMRLARHAARRVNEPGDQLLSKTKFGP